MNQRIPTYNYASMDQSDRLREETAVDTSDNSSDDHTKHELANASEYKSLEEYRAEVFGNKLRSARTR